MISMRSPMTWYQWYPLWSLIFDQHFTAKIQENLGHTSMMPGTYGWGERHPRGWIPWETQDQTSIRCRCCNPKKHRKVVICNYFGRILATYLTYLFFWFGAQSMLWGHVTSESPWFWPICISMDVLLLSRFQDEDAVPSISPIDTKLIGMKEPTITARPKSWVNHGKSPKLLREHED